jgi:hypothetical protein
MHFILAMQGRGVNRAATIAASPRAGIVVPEVGDRMRESLSLPRSYWPGLFHCYVGRGVVGAPRSDVTATA